MKHLTRLFGLALGGIAVSLVMTVVTAVQDHRVASEPPSTPVVVPAEVR